MDMDNILTKMNMFNNDVKYMFHAPILEYDMNAASLSLSERFQLLPKETIEELKLLPKDKRVYRTGLIRRENKEFSVTVDQKLRDVRKEFIDENDIKPDDILSLHSDAIIFTSRKKIKNVIDGITFKESSISRYLVKVFKYIENYDIQVLSYLSKFESEYLTDRYPEFMYSPFGMPGIFKFSNLDLFAYIAKIVLKETDKW